MNSLRLGTYNVLVPRTDTEGKGLDSWLSRRSAVIETIDREFDFVGLQECSFNPLHMQGQYIAEELNSRGWDGYLPYENKLFADEFHERIPIFWRRGSFTPRESGQLLLSSWTAEELASVPILENRYASYVEGRLADGRLLLFITLHLQHTTSKATFEELSLTERKRSEAQRRLVDFVSTRSDAPELFIAGDFNSSNLAAGLLGEHLFSAELMSSELERWEYNSFHDWGTLLTRSHLDQMYISKGITQGNSRIGDSLASDHYPVSYTLPH